MITNDWLTALMRIYKPYYRQLFEFVKDEYNTTVVFPPADDISTAASDTVKQGEGSDSWAGPYHNVGQAHGLCFP